MAIDLGTLLASALGNAGSRRRALAQVASGALALPWAFAASDAAAKRRKRKRRKKKRKNGCPPGTDGKVEDTCVQHCTAHEECPSGDVCLQVVDPDPGVRICGSYQEPFCRTVSDEFTCGHHGDCDSGQLCVFTACLPICVTPTFT